MEGYQSTAGATLRKAVMSKLQRQALRMALARQHQDMLPHSWL